MQNDRSRPDVTMAAVAHRRAELSGYQAISGQWRVIARRRGQELWRDDIHNLVVNEGLNALLGTTLTGEAQVTSWYTFVISGTPTVAAGDTMGSHAGWDEFTGVAETTRLVWPGSRSATGTATNPTAVQFTMDATGTVGGAGLTSSVSLGGSLGTLYAAGAFSGGNKVLNSGDTLDITATFTNTTV